MVLKLVQAHTGVCTGLSPLPRSLGPQRKSRLMQLVMEWSSTFSPKLMSMAAMPTRCTSSWSHVFLEVWEILSNGTMRRWDHLIITWHPYQSHDAGQWCINFFSFLMHTVSLWHQWHSSEALLPHHPASGRCLPLPLPTSFSVSDPHLPSSCRIFCQTCRTSGHRTLTACKSKPPLHSALLSPPPSSPLHALPQLCCEGFPLNHTQWGGNAWGFYDNCFVQHVCF